MHGGAFVVCRDADPLRPYSLRAYGQKHVDAISDAKAAGSKKAYKKMGKARRRKGRR